MSNKNPSPGRPAKHLPEAAVVTVRNCIGVVGIRSPDLDRPHESILTCGGDVGIDRRIDG